MAVARQHHGAAVKEQFLRRLAGDIERRGALDVLRNGLKDSGCKFRLACFRPASGLNEETRRLQMVRQHSERAGAQWFLAELDRIASP